MDSTKAVPSHPPSSSSSSALGTAERNTVDSGPLFTRCHRWRRHLSATSAAYGALELERERGWNSPALDAWYNNQRTQLPHGGATMKTTKDHPQQQKTAAAAVPESATTATTSFAEADISQLTERYRAHSRRILAAAAPTVFVPLTKAAESGRGIDGQADTMSPPSPLFLDMGCAPGGVSKYLVEDLGWRGYGLTLPASAGGIAMDPELTGESAEEGRFTLWEGDVTEPPETWRRPSTTEKWESTRRFRFVNGGAVQDHGQRLKQQQQQPEHQEEGDTSEKDHSPLSSPSPPVLTSGAILPWLTLAVPQLRTALEYVAEGGTVMLVYGAPQCASLMILLRALEPLFHGPDAPTGSGSAGESEAVSVLATMHVMKPPVYVLLHRVYTSGNEGRIARLLAALDAGSDVLSPLEESDTTVPPLSSLSAADRLRVKQRFWLGECDAGFALAREGLTRYGHLINDVWEQARRCLLHRRLRAERALGVGSGRSTERRRWSVNQNSDDGNGKRPRE